MACRLYEHQLAEEWAVMCFFLPDQAAAFTEWADSSRRLFGLPENPFNEGDESSFWGLSCFVASVGYYPRGYFIGTVVKLDERDLRVYARPWSCVLDARFWPE
jgi:hypothetical protein